MKEAIQILSQDKTLKQILHIEINIPYFDGDVNAYLYNSIISQQLSTKAAASIYDRFLDYFDGQTPTCIQILNTPDEELRAIGLSRAKTHYVKNVATFFEEQDISAEYWLKKSDDEIIDLLTSIKGVGKWTVQMVLIFCLARRDVFPILDLGVRNSAIELYQLTGDKKKIDQRLLKIADKWQPYRSIASLYLWAWRNHQNGKL